jgi:galactokinase
MDVNGHHDIFVPGRLCILGEHSDWAAEYMGPSPMGLALVCSTNEGLHSTCRRQHDKTMTFISTDNQGAVREFREDLDYACLIARTNDEFFGYVAGTAAIILQRC